MLQLVSFNYIPISLNKSVRNLLIDHGFWLDMINDGNPCNLTIPENILLARIYAPYLQSSAECE